MMSQIAVQIVSNAFRSTRAPSLLFQQNPKAILLVKRFFPKYLCPDPKMP